MAAVCAMTSSAGFVVEPQRPEAGFTRFRSPLAATGGFVLRIRALALVCL